MKQNPNKCKCGCEQVLTEINYIRDIEQPAAESEIQNILYHLDELMDMMHTSINFDHTIFDSEEFKNAEILIMDRYIRNPKTVSDDDLPF